MPGLASLLQYSTAAAGNKIPAAAAPPIYQFPNLPILPLPFLQRQEDLLR